MFVGANLSQTYPIAYLEFVSNEDGTTTKLGPHNEKDELKAQDQWLVGIPVLLNRVRLTRPSDKERSRSSEDPRKPRTTDPGAREGL